MMAPSAPSNFSAPLEALRILLPPEAFSEAELQEMLPLCEIQQHEAGSILITEGEPSDNRVYFLLEGSVSVFIQSRFILRLKNRGDTVGEMGLISAAPRSATVKTDQPSSFLVIHAALNADEGQGTDYKFRYYLSRLFNSILTEKLRKTSDRARLYEDMISRSQKVKQQQRKLQGEIARYLGELNVYTHLVDSAQDAILVADTLGRVLNANRALERSFGLNTEAVIGMDLTNLLCLAPEGASSWPEIARMAGEMGWNGEVSVSCDLAQPIPADCAVSAINDPNNGRLAYSVILRDARERKAYEEHILQQQRELENANQELQALDTAKSRFLTMVSHQLRTPITAIQAYAETLNTEGMVDPEDQAGFIGVIYQEAEKLGHMVNKVLAISRLATGQMLFRFSADHLDELVRAQVAQMRPRAQAKGLELTLNIEGHAGPVVFDHDQIQEVLAQILDNAIKYTDTGSIEVSFAQNGKDSLIHVRDTGKGIQGNDIQAMLDTFARGDSVETGEYGLGLGLPLCHLIVKAHSGEFRLEGEPGKGTTVSVKLPNKPSLDEQAG